MEKLLLTGASGFVGRNIKHSLQQLYCVTTCGISESDDVKANLATDVPHLPCTFDVVLHICGKAHTTPRTDAERQEFYDVNYTGTINLCKALEKIGVPKSLIYLSSVAVYGCESGTMITECHQLQGNTPYAHSKILAEQYLTEWSRKHGVRLGILRAALIAGKDAPGNLGAMVSGIRRGIYFNIAGGKAEKSFLMVDDIVRLLPAVVAKGGIYNVCDSPHISFGQMAECIARQLGRKNPLSLPYALAWCIAKAGDIIGSKAPFNSPKLAKMTQSLTFSNAKAREELGWTPLDVLTHYQI